MEIWLPSYMAIFINHYNGSLWTKTSKIRLVTKVSFTQTSVGTFLTAPRFAIFLNTAGGAWDNAKKYIEQGCGRWDLPPTDRILDLNLYVVGDHFPCFLVHVYFFQVFEDVYLISFILFVLRKRFVSSSFYFCKYVSFEWLDFRSLFCSIPHPLWLHQKRREIDSEILPGCIPHSPETQRFARNETVDGRNPAPPGM